VTLIPLSYDNHAKTKIRPLQSYAFAAGETLIPLYASDIIPISYEVPVLFVSQSGDFTLAALLGLSAGQNLLVDAQGRWMGAHVPGIWRRGPFRLANVEGSTDDTLIVCLDHASDRVSESVGEPLYDDQGSPTPLVGAATTLLSRLEHESRNTREICARLQRLGLLTPWMVEIQQPDGKPTRIPDLFQIDERKIAALSGDDLVSLRDVGALSVIYAHLMSLPKVQVLARLARMAAERNQHREALQKGKLNLDQTFGIVEDDPFIF
jgi:hypothetical protein